MIVPCSTYNPLVATYVLQLLALLVVSPCVSAAHVGDDPVVHNPAELRFQIAHESAQAGDFETALQAYTKLMLEEPDNVDYVFGYAQALYWSGEIDRSLCFLEAARKLAPGYEDIWALEYRVLNSGQGVRSSAAINEFRESAAEHFPNAVWLHETQAADQEKYRWTLNADRDYLDNGTPDWQSIETIFGWPAGKNGSFSIAAKSAERFATKDTQFGVGASFDLSPVLRGNIGVTVSSSPRFLPEKAMELGLVRRFQHGWLLNTRWRRRDYENDSVNSFAVGIERYIGKYRAAYSLNSAHLGSEQALVHAVVANLYAHSGTQLGVILAIGEEIEAVAAGSILKTDIWSAAITGRHPINDRLYAGWRLGTHQQGRLYRRNTIGISFSGAF